MQIQPITYQRVLPSSRFRACYADELQTCPTPPQSPALLCTTRQSRRARCLWCQPHYPLPLATRTGASPRQPDRADAQVARPQTPPATAHPTAPGAANTRATTAIPQPRQSQTPCPAATLRQQRLPLPSVSTIGRIIARQPDKMRLIPQRLDSRGRPKPFTRNRKNRKPKGLQSKPLQLFACDTITRIQHGIRRGLFTVIVHLHRPQYPLRHRLRRSH